MKHRLIPTEKRNEFLCGFACVLSFLIKFHDEPSIALDAMSQNGITLNDLIEGGVEKYDIDIIKKASQLVQKR